MSSSFITLAQPGPAKAPTRSVMAKAPARSTRSPNGLQVTQVLEHVASLSAREALPGGIDCLVETAEVCGRLLAIRRQLFIALHAQRRIDLLARVAQGREQAQLINAADADSLQPVVASMQVCVDEVLAHWRDTGKAFTRLTRLLPTQLDHDLVFPPTLMPAEHRALVSRFVRVQESITAERFDAACEAYMSAHRRCQSRVGPALAARERRRRAELNLRGAGTAMKTLALAMFEEFLSRQSLLVAEGDRAGAHHVLHLLVDPPMW